jgi:hypothetical protein
MPVHFQWQLLDWPAPSDVLAEMGLKLALTTSATLAANPLLLVETPPPDGVKRGGEGTRDRRTVKRAVHPDQDARNKALGLAGELLVLAAERRKLIDAGRPDLANRITHTSVVEGDGAGYDIRSFAPAGTIRYLEVKTTRSGLAAAFYISPNEVAFSQAHPDSFELVRVYKYDAATETGYCYRLCGPVPNFFSLEPSEFRAYPA